MSWLFSRALVEEYLGDTCSDGEPSAQLSGNPIQQAYCAPDRMTKFSRLSRFGMTFKPLTADRGAELLTSYLAAFHAKTSAPQERAQESTEPDPECGATWRESFAKWNPDTSMWKTPQCSLLEDSIEFSGTWPRWGLMRDGVSYQRQTLVPRTKGIGSGSWLMPTPTTNPEAPNHGSNSKGPHNLKEVALTGWKPGMTWPTPISQDAKHSGYAQSGPGKAEKLSYAVVKWQTPTVEDASRTGSAEAWEKYVTEGKTSLCRLRNQVHWPTPTAHNAKEGAYPAEFTRNTPTLSAQAGGMLNPTWVEWLMGWPLGWTDLKPLATDKYQQWQQQHGVSSNEET